MNLHQWTHAQLQQKTYILWNVFFPLSCLLTPSFLPSSCQGTIPKSAWRSKRTFRTTEGTKPLLNPKSSGSLCFVLFCFFLLFLIYLLNYSPSHHLYYHYCSITGFQTYRAFTSQFYLVKTSPYTVLWRAHCQLDFYPPS